MKPGSGRIEGHLMAKGNGGRPTPYAPFQTSKVWLTHRAMSKSLGRTLVAGGQKILPNLIQGHISSLERSQPSPEVGSNDIRTCDASLS
jgi:hypothetical protein